MKARISLAAAILVLGVPAAGVPAPAQEFVEKLTAVSANVAEPGQPLRIDILEWSSDEDRESLINAIDPPPAPVAEVDESAGGGRGGRGGGGRGGRGGRGGEPADPVLAALEEAPTVGYIWTERITGYPVRYASRAPLPNGGERIVLVTNRRLGVHTTAWDPVETDYEFTLIEIRLGPDGVGEGKASLTAEVAVEDGSPALANYDGAMAVLESVRRR